MPTKTPKNKICRGRAKELVVRKGDREYIFDDVIFIAICPRKAKKKPAKPAKGKTK